MFAQLAGRGRILVDMLLITGVLQSCLHVFLQDDFKLGKKLATGGFGTVYRAALDDGSPEGRQVIVKKVRQQFLQEEGSGCTMPVCTCKFPDCEAWHCPA